MKAIFAFIILACSVSLAFWQPKLVGALNKCLIKIETISPDSSFSDLTELTPILSDKNIVGLGEATHGTYEFFVFKNRVIKLLTMQANFKIFIIEGDFAGSQIMNDYVIDGKGTINKALWDVGIGVWMTQEFVDFVAWMKKYNADKSPNNKIKFYGCDIQNPMVAAKKTEEYLKKGYLLNPSLENRLNWVINRKYQKKLSKEDQDIIKLLLDELKAVFKSINNENDQELKFIKHCNRELEQFFEYTLADSRTQLILRDKFMAENIEWIYDYENHSKTVFWAHNEHVKNDKAESEQKPTGYYLKEKFHNEYYSLGFGFYDGGVRGYNTKTRKWEVYNVPKITMNKSTDAVFKQCSALEFILDFETARSNNLIWEFLNTKLYRRSIGAGYFPENKKLNHYKESKLIDTFDGLIFFRNTSPSSQMKE